MDKVHIHLLANHAPILGAFFGALVLIYGMVRKSPPTLAAAYIVFIIASVAGLITYFTGSGAAGAVKNLPDVARPLIREHAEWGKFTLYAFIVLGAFSIAGFVFVRNHYDRIKGLAIIILLISVVSLGIGAYAGLIGGQIRHSEVRSAAMLKHAIEEHGDSTNRK